MSEQKLITKIEGLEEKLSRAKSNLSDLKDLIANNDGECDNEDDLLGELDDGKDFIEGLKNDLFYAKEMLEQLREHNKTIA